MGDVPASKSSSDMSPLAALFWNRIGWWFRRPTVRDHIRQKKDMFYSEFVLAKKGALGKVWLAAHWEKKLTRTQMSKSNITEACASIIKVGAKECQRPLLRPKVSMLLV